MNQRPMDIPQNTVLVAKAECAHELAEGELLAAVDAVGLGDGEATLPVLGLARRKRTLHDAVVGNRDALALREGVDATDDTVGVDCGNGGSRLCLLGSLAHCL